MTDLTIPKIIGIPKVWFAEYMKKKKESLGVVTSTIGNDRSFTSVFFSKILLINVTTWN